MVLNVELKGAED